MQSVTKAKVPFEVVQGVAQSALNRDILAVTELKEGYFNAAFRLDMADGTRAVMKVAPHRSIKLLRYEVGLMATEVAAMGLVRSQTSVPVPAVLAHDASLERFDHEFFIMEFLPGEPLHLLQEKLSQLQVEAIDEQMAALLSQMNQIYGSRFGIFADARFDTWPSAFLSVFAGVFVDAQEAGLELPLARVKQAIAKVAPDLQEVSRPQFVHWDIWSGNIFVDPVTLTISGIIDFERAWWADPMMEVNFMNPSPQFLKSYGQGQVNPSARRRRFLYDIYLGCVMQVEHVLRGYPDGEPATAWGLNVLMSGLDALGV